MKYKVAKCLLGIALIGTLTGCSLFTPQPVNSTSDAKPPQGGTHAQLLGIDPADSNNQYEHSDSTEDNHNTTDNHNADNEPVSGNNSVDESVQQPSNVPEIDINNKGDAEGTFQTKDFSGNTFTQEIFTKSKLNVVNIWGTYCGYCIEEMPDLGDLASQYDSSEVQFIGIVCDVWEGDDTSYAQSIVDETGANYLHLVSNYSINDWKLNSVEFIPQTFLIDETGKTIDVIDGMLYKDEWIDVIEYYKQ